MVHERGAGERGWRRRRKRKRGQEVQTPDDSETVHVQTQERAGVQVADQQVGSARHGILHVRGHQRYRKNSIHRGTPSQRQPFQ